MELGSRHCLNKISKRHMEECTSKLTPLPNKKILISILSILPPVGLLLSMTSNLSSLVFSLNSLEKTKKR